jgi:transcriptional regulator with PAS, ATPase and Fis domain
LRKNTTGVEPAAMECLTAYDWPGNIRELRNIIERVMILENKDRIELDDLPVELVNQALRNDGKPLPAASGEALSLDEIEKQAIHGALERAGQNQVQAAKLLGVTRDRLRYRMKKFGFLADSRG